MTSLLACDDNISWLGLAVRAKHAAGKIRGSPSEGVRNVSLRMPRRRLAGTNSRPRNIGLGSITWLRRRPRCGSSPRPKWCGRRCTCAIPDGAPVGSRGLAGPSTANVRELLKAVLPLPQLTPQEAMDLVITHLINRARSTSSRLKSQVKPQELSECDIVKLR